MADSLNFFSRNLCTADQDALAGLVEDYFTSHGDNEDNSGK